MSKKNFGAGPEWFFLAALLAPSALQASRPLGRKIANSLEELGRLLNEAMDEADAAEREESPVEEPVPTTFRSETSNVVKSADDVPPQASGPGLATGFSMKVAPEEPKKSVFVPEPEEPKATFEAPKVFEEPKTEAPKAVEPVKPVAFEAPKPEVEAPKAVEPVKPVAFEAPKPEVEAPKAVEPVKPVAFEAPKPEVEAPKAVEPVKPVAFEAPKPEVEAPQAVEPVKPVAFEAPKPEVAEEPKFTSAPAVPVESASETAKVEEAPKQIPNPFASMVAGNESQPAPAVAPRPFEAMRAEPEAPAAPVASQPEPAPEQTPEPPKVSRTLGEAVMNQTWGNQPQAESADDLLNRFEAASGGTFKAEPEAPVAPVAPVAAAPTPEPLPTPAPIAQPTAQVVTSGEYQLPKPPPLDSAPIPKVEDILPQESTNAPKALSPEEIAARFEDGPAAQAAPAVAPTPAAPVAKGLTPEEIAARFESGEAPAPATQATPPAAEPAAASKGLTPEEIAARFESGDAPKPAATQEIAAQFESSVAKASSEHPIANPTPSSALPFDQSETAEGDPAAEWGSMFKPAPQTVETTSVGTWDFAEQKRTETGPPPTQAAPPRRPQDAEVLRKGFEQQQPGGKRSLRERMGFKSNRQESAPPPVATVASGPPPLQVMPGSAPQNAAPPVQRNRFVVPSDVDTA